MSLLTRSLEALDQESRGEVEFVEHYLGHVFSEQVAHRTQGSGQQLYTHVIGPIVRCACGWEEQTTVNEVPFRAARHARDVIKRSSRQLPGWILTELEKE